MKTKWPLPVFALITLLGLTSGPTVRGQGVAFTNLHSFVYTNGTGPVATPLLAGGVLYGTTRIDGENGFFSGYGSVFKVNTDGSGYTTLRVFTNGPDGGNLAAGLVLAGGLLYSPAAFGGASNYGTIFGLGTNGTGLTNLFNFPATSADFPYTNGPGAYPQGGLVFSGGLLYGTANGGGAAGWGTLFAIGTNGGGFTNLHHFAVSDGQMPSAALLLSGGTLYGMTPDGGNGVGTIFKVSTNGTGFTNLYTFSYLGGYPYTNDDGASPVGSLILNGNTLYGTTSSGGSNACGTLFKVNTDGSGFTPLYYFSGLAGTLQTNRDGAHPQSELTLYGNALYGTTQDGGGSGNGTLFRVNLDGSGFTTLYHFTATNNAAGTNADGAHPVGGLVASGSVLYGTASAGGVAGYGTVFSLLVPPPLTVALAGTNVIVTWPTNVNGFSLQSATNLAPPVTWSAVSGQYVVTNALSGKLKVFRLTHP